MFKRYFLLIAALLAFPSASWAGAKVTEGDEAAKFYAAEKGKAQILAQKNKEFILRSPNGKETIKPAVITVKAKERFFISNEEELVVHNVYDTSDSSWVLRKQQPSGVAAISFDKPGTHTLRCAIHPIMKIDVRVVP